MKSRKGVMTALTRSESPAQMPSGIPIISESSTAVGFTVLGMQGLWTESMDTLALTTTAVLLSLMIGIPLGIWAGLSDRVNAVMTPFLDFMQTMPTFAYLAPLTLVFLIGPASAT